MVSEWGQAFPYLFLTFSLPAHPLVGMFAFSLGGPGTEYGNHP